LIGKSLTNILVAKAEFVGNKFTINWSKTISFPGLDLEDISAVIDEYDEMYIVGTYHETSGNVRNKIAVLKIDSSAAVKFYKSYTFPDTTSVKSIPVNYDQFDVLNVGVSAMTSAGDKISYFTKLKYDGSVIQVNKLMSDSDEEGIQNTAVFSDISGDPVVAAQVHPNRTQFLFNAESAYTDAVGRAAELTRSGTVNLEVDAKFGSGSYEITQDGKISATGLTLNSTEFTVEQWIKMGTAPTTGEPVLLHAFDASTGVKVMLRADSTDTGNYGKLRLSNNSGSITDDTTAQTFITDLTAGWVHIALLVLILTRYSGMALKQQLLTRLLLT
jgi:hypothetical protein